MYQEDLNLSKTAKTALNEFLMVGIEEFIGILEKISHT
jgi:hypothetical protein